MVHGRPRGVLTDVAIMVKEVHASGFNAVKPATPLLQRSDQVERLFWLEDDGPVCAVLLTASAD